MCGPHRLFVEMLAEVLRGDGHQVRVTTHPQEAFDVLTSEPLDLCLIDLRFPEGEHAGLKAIPALRRAAPQTKVLLLCASVSGPLARAAEEAGATAIVSKHAPLSEVLESVRRAQSGPRLVEDQPQADRAVARLVPLSRRESQVLGLLTEGFSTRDVVAALDVSESTARGLVQNVLEKLDVHTRLEAAAAVRTVTNAMPMR